MASNKDLAARALELGRELGEEVETAGLNNAKLAELVGELEARASAMASDLAPADGPLPTFEEAMDRLPELKAGESIRFEGLDSDREELARLRTPATTAEPKPATYRVAAGKAVNTLSREVQGPGVEVTAADFQQGALRLEQLHAAGYLVKR